MTCQETRDKELYPFEREKGDERKSKDFFPGEIDISPIPPPPIEEKADKGEVVITVLSLRERNFMGKNTKVRVQFDLPKYKLDELDALKKEAGLETRRELFNYAFTLLEWAVEQRKQGRVIASISEEQQSYRELVMPMLQNIPKQETA